MNVYYCPICQRYFFISSYLYRSLCKVCGHELLPLPISFKKFTEMDEHDRQVFIQNLDL